MIIICMNKTTKMRGLHCLFIIYFNCFMSAQGRSCGAVWTFERHVDTELRGFVRETQVNVTKTQCEDFCLSESRCDIARCYLVLSNGAQVRVSLGHV